LRRIGLDTENGGFNDNSGFGTGLGLKNEYCLTGGGGVDLRGNTGGGVDLRGDTGRGGGGGGVDLRGDTGRNGGDGVDLRGDTVLGFIFGSKFL
jgi:hypothetical protein